MLRRWPSLDPDARKDYGFDWSDWLNGDTIQESTWTVTGGTITEDGTNIVGDVTIIWLKDGVLGEELTITNHITTAAGREDDRSALLTIKQR